MRYVGGKSKLAKGISEAILSNTESRGTYWEPFLGGAAMLAKMAPHFDRSFASDLNQDIALMWRDSFAGAFVPPSSVSELEYQNAKSLEPSALRGFIGFGCSFGGKWFGGMARGGKNADGSKRNYGAESSRAVERIAHKLLGQKVEVSWGSYQEIEPESGDVVYCDPPYAETTGYSTGVFDSAKFWDWAEALSRRGVHVFVSEYSAPPGWSSIWSQNRKQSLSMSEVRPNATEGLFVFTGSEPS